MNEYCAQIHELTDLGNAYRFAQQHVGLAFYCKDSSVWLAWDGRRFTSEQQIVQRLALETIQSIHREAQFTKAAIVDSHGDPVTIEDIRKHAKRSSRPGALKAMLQLAASFPEMQAMSSDFDSRPDLLNVANGVVDLMNGELLPHDPGLKLCRIVDLPYSPEAPCPKWTKFISDIAAEDGELSDFLHVLSGYALTGETREQCFFLCFGHGSNGKSLFMKMLLATQDEYGMDSPHTSLLKGNHSNVRNDIARLAGARLVTAIEVNRGSFFDEALIKSLTGGDLVTARKLYQEHTSFLPQFKLALTVNHLPRIEGRDEGIWRRIRVVPFTRRFHGDSRNPNIEAELREELEGILAWRVQGAVRWYNHGLTSPKVVEDATAKYRQSQDILGEFLKDVCVKDAASRITKRQLHERFLSWAKEAGNEPMKINAFGHLMISAGIQGQKSGSTHFWKGLKLREDSTSSGQANI